MHSRRSISTKSSKAKMLPEDTAVSIRTVYQPRSEKRKHIRHRGISTTISRAKAYLAQPAMMGEFNIYIYIIRSIYIRSIAKRKYSWHSRISTKSSKASPVYVSPMRHTKYTDTVVVLGIAWPLRIARTNDKIKETHIMYSYPVNNHSSTSTRGIRW